MRAWRGRPGGFTLIEVLIVVTILGILVTIAGTSVSRQLTLDRAVRAARVVEGMLVEATQVALRRRVPIRIQGSGTALQIVERGTGTVIRARRFGQGSDLEAVLTLDPVAGVTVFPNGRADGELSVTVATDGAQFVVRRTATGIVRRP